MCAKNLSPQPGLLRCCAPGPKRRLGASATGSCFDRAQRRCLRRCIPLPQRAFGNGKMGRQYRVRGKTRRGDTCRVFIAFFQKTTYLDGLALAAYAATGRMVKKTACGYFLLLRNKKQLILMAPPSPLARQPGGWPKKIAAARLFFIAPQ